MAQYPPTHALLLTLDYHLFWLADTHDFFYPEAGPGRGASGPTNIGEPVSYGRNPELSGFVGSEIDLDHLRSQVLFSGAGRLRPLLRWRLRPKLALQSRWCYRRGLGLCPNHFKFLV